MVTDWLIWRSHAVSNVTLIYKISCKYHQLLHKIRLYATNDRIFKMYNLLEYPSHAHEIMRVKK